jgi:hypothetical protein
MRTYKETATKNAADMEDLLDLLSLRIGLSLADIAWLKAHKGATRDEISEYLSNRSNTGTLDDD